MSALKRSRCNQQVGTAEPCCNSRACTVARTTLITLQTRTPPGQLCPPCMTARPCRACCWLLTSVDTMDTVVAAIENCVNIRPSRLMPCSSPRRV